MDIQKTIRQLCLLSEVARETIQSDEMSEIHLIAVNQEDVEALRKAVVVLESVRIMNGVFDKEATS